LSGLPLSGSEPPFTAGMNVDPELPDRRAPNRGQPPLPDARQAESFALKERLVIL
jgi:hypothetical protein